MTSFKCTKCGKETSDNEKVCIHCGCSIESEILDTNISESENPSIQTVDVTAPQTQETRDKPPKRTLIIWASVICIIIGAIFVSQQPFAMSDSAKDDKISSTYVNEGYNEAVSLIYEYYGTSDKAITWMMAISDSADKGTIRDIEVVEQNLQKDGNYFDYDVTVKNNSSETISYIKVNIYLMDKDGNIVDTEWTNWSGNLLPDASAKIDKMIDYDSSIQKYRVEIDEISTK